MPKRRKLKKPHYPDTERGNWNHFHGRGRRCAIRRRLLRKKFEQGIPVGMSPKEYLLSSMSRYIGHGNKFEAGTAVDYLESVHPSAWRFLALHGIDYRQYSWPNPPSIGEPQRKKCFLNAMVLAYLHSDTRKQKKGERKLGIMGRHTLYHVQGIAFGSLVKPMLHGWNAFGVRRPRAVDWTFYAANKWTHYVGVPLTYEEMVEVAKTKHPATRLISLFDKESFDLKVRVALARVLQKRKRAGKKVPIRPKAVQKKILKKGKTIRSPGKRRGSFLSYLKQGSPARILENRGRGLSDDFLIKSSGEKCRPQKISSRNFLNGNRRGGM